MAPRTVSVVNMKGGVGKSTTVASLAETLASEGLRVLVIDLDPQSNVSMMLAGQDRWVELRQANRTIDEYFNQYVYGGEPRFFREFVANRVSDIAGEPSLDLLISTPEFRYIERHALEKWVSQGFDIRQLNTRFSRLTHSAIENVADSYDLVLFDCPPGISMFAEAAIELSEFIVIPTIPDYVSRLGIFAFRKRALRSMEQRRFTDDRIYTLITKYEAGNSLHQSEAALLKDQFNVFETRIPQAEQIARAAEWSDHKRTLEQKYGDAAAVIRKFAGEFRERVGLI
ncbi:MAG TPA: ParA family protein [Hyphomonadaceae bacterium]|nr:ParA family protein [Hyphomonadaceae bacterium]HPI49036.1 ParA family protein [Hyphomonadaceae bacterium]